MQWCMSERRAASVPFCPKCGNKHIRDLPMHRTPGPQVDLWVVPGNTNIQAAVFCECFSFSHTRHTFQTICMGGDKQKINCTFAIFLLLSQSRSRDGCLLLPNLPPLRTPTFLCPTFLRHGPDSCCTSMHVRMALTHTHARAYYRPPVTTNGSTTQMTILHQNIISQMSLGKGPPLSKSC
jgi:hypothetical protein